MPEERRSAEEREVLLTYVKTAQEAISALRPTDMRVRRLPSAMSEIGMIVESTETAANQIMESVDEILSAPADMDVVAYRSLVESKCISMMEACAFQDLAGQRSSKVIATLLHLEDKLGMLAVLLGNVDELDGQGPPPPLNEDDLLLNGPSMPGEGVDQDDIDRLFSGAA